MIREYVSDGKSIDTTLENCAEDENKGSYA